MNLTLKHIHARLGDLWWYSILLFVAQRFGDVINMIVGLWIVPKYVPQQELGAVLPLSQFVSLIGLPLGVIAVPFMKYLSVYAERNELGKVKALLRDVFLWTVVLALLTFLFAYLVLPLLFERMRVATGSLGALIVFISILLAVSVIFQNAVQGLKLYSTTIWFNVLAAPLRLVLLVVFMPFRPMSGYFVGQGAAPGVSIAGAIWALRKKLGRQIRPQPYWAKDGKAMLRYALPIAVALIFSTVGSSVDQLIIRHRLSDFDSAGYYIISRFAEIATYLGSAFIVFLFPMVSGRGKKDRHALRVLKQSLAGVVLGGLGVVGLLAIGGRFILGLQDAWRPYQSLSPDLVLLAFVNTTTLLCSCLSTFETAQGRFRYLWYALPITIVRAVGMYALTGYSFFAGYVPELWLEVIRNLNPNRLEFLLTAFLIFNVITLLALCVDVFGTRSAT